MPITYFYQDISFGNFQCYGFNLIFISFFCKIKAEIIILLALLIKYHNPVVMKKLYNEQVTWATTSTLDEALRVLILNMVLFSRNNHTIIKDTLNRTFYKNRMSKYLSFVFKYHFLVINNFYYKYFFI